MISLAASLLAVIIIGCFGFVLFYGAPYLPTLSAQVEPALKLAGLRAGDHLLELGCGDGKVLLAAARQGIRATGYELNPLLYALAWLRTRRQRRLITVRWADFWRAGWPAADAIFVFLLPKYMKKLDTKIGSYAADQPRPVRLVSFAFTIPGRPPDGRLAGLCRYDYGRRP